MQVAPVFEGNECIGAVAVLYDITRLRQLERMRRDFVANVSHELCTPLTAIKGYAEILSDGAVDDQATARRFTGIIESHADRLTHLLGDLLDLSRLESDQLEVELIPCELKLFGRYVRWFGQPSGRAKTNRHSLRHSAVCPSDLRSQID